MTSLTWYNKSSFLQKGVWWHLFKGMIFMCVNGGGGWNAFGVYYRNSDSALLSSHFITILNT